MNCFSCMPHFVRIYMVVLRCNHLSLVNSMCNLMHTNQLNTYMDGTKGISLQTMDIDSFKPHKCHHHI